MAILLKTASIRVSFIQIMQIRVQNKSRRVWKSRYDGDVSIVDAAERSSHVAAAWENVSREGKDSHIRMHAMFSNLMDRISGWMKLQDEMNASFENATTVIWGLGADNDGNMP